MNFKSKIKQKIKKLIIEVLNEKTSNNISIQNKIPISSKITESILSGDIDIGERSYVDKCHLLGKISIGNNTSVNGPNTDIHCVVNSVKIGNFCSIARNVSIQEYNHFFSHATSYFIKHYLFGDNWEKEITSKGDIIIGNDVWIGTQCVILSGVEIGNGAVIAANSVVTKNIPPFAIAAGSPAKVIKYRFDKQIIEKLQTVKWWNWSVEKIKNNYDFFKDKLTLEKFNNITI